MTNAKLRSLKAELQKAKFRAGSLSYFDETEAEYWQRSKRMCDRIIE